jgi:hypothetical protein
MKDRNVDEGFSCVYQKEMFRCQRINSGLVLAVSKGYF